MTLQSSGAISLANVQTEFGGSNPISISEYYGVASGVPTSGTISLSNFYGKSSIIPFSYLGSKVIKVFASGGTSISFTGFNNVGGAVAQGDVLIFAFMATTQGVTVNIGNPSGPTVIQQNVGTDSARTYLRTYYYVVPASPANTFTWSRDSYNMEAMVFIYRFRGLTLTGGSPVWTSNINVAVNTAYPTFSALSTGTRPKYVWFGSASYVAARAYGASNWSPSQISGTNNWVSDFYVVGGQICGFSGWSTSNSNPGTVSGGIYNIGTSSSAAAGVRLYGNT